MQLALIVKNISFQLPSGDSLFSDISATFGMNKTGLVGKNGVGKTTFLKMLVGEIEPTKGNIDAFGLKIGYLPQDYQFDLDATVAEALDISEKMKALEKVSNGEGDEKLLECIGLDWDILERTQVYFKEFDLDHIALDRRLKTLSGGEKMKIALVKLFLFKANFLILDEPTNNLDYETKKIVYDVVKNWQGGLLVVSHDRELLNLMENIVELSEKGIRVYGGNFAMYKDQKNVEEKAAEEDFFLAQQELRKIKKQSQKVAERQQKRASHGKKMRGKAGIPRIVLGLRKGNAEKTSSALKISHQKRVEQATLNKDKAREKIPEKNRVILDLGTTKVPKGKLISRLKNLTFSYEQGKPLFENFHFTIEGPERVALQGKNGSGKTTLVKILVGEILPQSGEVYKGFEKYAYLEQNTTMLDLNKTLLENLEQSAEFSESIARNWLAKFLFYEQDVFKKVKDLSGGERVKAKLSCILAGDHPPHLLILDEPTNNLDLDSIEQLESALLNYEGALLAISHDESFLKNIGIEREVVL